MAAEGIPDFEKRLRFVLCMHNKTRCLVEPNPGTPAGHFINENTVVRLAAMMEAAGMKAPHGETPDNVAWPETCVRTLFLLRNIIVHEAEGYYWEEELKLTQSRRHLPAFRKFARAHGAAEVSEGEKLGLDAQEVITPLVDGCVEYARERGKLRVR